MIHVTDAGDIRGFNIKLDFGSAPWASEALTEIITAAEQISSIIADAGKVRLNNADITITVRQENLNGFWGFGGYTKLHRKTTLPNRGYLKLDPGGIDGALNAGVLDELAFHEMLHAMGFGVLWAYKGLLRQEPGDILRFIGPKATAAYETAYPALFAADPHGRAGVPVETEAGAGSAGLHWAESWFDKEVMTPALDRKMHLSDITVASLEDLGYRLKG